MEWINSIAGIKAWWLTNANPQNSQHNAFLTNSLKNISKGVDVKVAKLGEDLVIVSMKKGNCVPWLTKALIFIVTGKQIGRAHV